MHPVVTDMRKAEAILAWAVEKMEERYALLARAGVRHISVYNQLGEEELMDRLQPENDDERSKIPTQLALHRDRGRRNGRPDDDRRQRSRAAHHPAGAKEPGRRHPPGAGHAKADRRRDHRPDQVEPAGTHRLPGRQPHRQPRRARRNGGRQTAGQRRHALPLARHQHPAPRTRNLCQRRRNQQDRSSSSARPSRNSSRNWCSSKPPDADGEKSGNAAEPRRTVRSGRRSRRPRRTRQRVAAATRPWASATAGLPGWSTSWPKTASSVNTTARKPARCC